jgi:outer membrane protein assembly factor BamB
MVGTNATTVFVRSTTARPAGPLDARSRATGRSRWTYTMPPETAPGFTSKIVASNAQLTVVASGGFLGGSSVAGVFKPIGSTILFTLDSTTGRELHRTVVDDPELIFSHAVLHDGVLALVNGNEIIGINLAAGTLVWRHPIPRPNSNYRGVLARGAGGRVAFFTDSARQGTFALDTVTGATLWSRPGFTPMSPAGAGSVVLLVQSGKYKRAPIVGVDVVSGRTRWTRTLRSTYAVPEPILGQAGLAPMAVRCGTP